METTIQTNPLSKYMRQPKIYIRLPSQGQYWPAGSLNKTETGEYAVYSMTAKDELMLKVPDALLNGQAVVDVIQNCVPDIKNAWHVPAIDLDVLLVAIRIATYGEKMKTPINFEGSEDSDIDLEYAVDLRSVLDTLMNQISWNPVVPINEEMTMYIRPMPYSQQTKLGLQVFETQKLISIANNETISDDDKLKVFKESFGKLTTITIDLAGDAIYKIDTVEGTVDNPQHIKEFVQNMDKDMFNKIQTHMEQLKEQNSIKPIVVPVTEDMKAKGVKGETLEIPLAFDVSSFFG
jgi:hypothetical protein